MENCCLSDKHGLVCNGNAQNENENGNGNGNGNGMEMEMYKNRTQRGVVRPQHAAWVLRASGNSSSPKPFTWAFIKSFGCRTNGIRRTFSHSAFGFMFSHGFLSHQAAGLQPARPRHSVHLLLLFFLCFIFLQWRRFSFHLFTHSMENP